MTETTSDLQYTCYAVFARKEPIHLEVGEQAASLVSRLAEGGTTVRGWYDITGMPATADLLVWLHGPQPEKLQDALRTLGHQVFRDQAELTWSAFGVHRQAEFSRDHAPAFMSGAAPKNWLTMYPFVRSYEWYVLPEDERRELLIEHGRAGREYPQVLSNTVAAFALGDYEWLLGLEADELTDLVDLMRHLRATGARRHVRLEVPFFTGRRIGTDELSRVLR